MINEKAKDYISEAVKREYEAAVATHGATYHSYHEAESVLREEAEEVFESVRQLMDAVGNIWMAIKRNKDTKTLQELFSGAGGLATSICEEAVQVAAVCMKAGGKQ